MKNGSIILLELGICVLDDQGKSLFSKKFSDPVGAYNLLQQQQAPQELNDIGDELRRFEKIVVNDSNLYYLLRNSGLNVDMMLTEQQQEIKRDAVRFAVKCSLSSDEGTAVQQLRDFAIKLSSSVVKDVSGRLDLHVIQAINALDELDKTINVLAARVREWYGLHFPELDHLVQSLNAYAEIVSSAGRRDKITNQILQDTGIPEKKAEIILSGIKRSKGGDINDEHITLVRKLADQVVKQSRLRKDLENDVETTMEKVAPNVKELLTALVGARIIARAGNLQRLATFPASTIQILGAEKALFRSLKTGASPPKHGMLFQHPLVHTAPRWQRGKIARAIAAKVAIAARIDAYRHDGADPHIAERLKKRISEILEKNKLPRVEEKSLSGRMRGRPWNRSNRGYQHGYQQFQRQRRNKRAKKKKLRKR